MILNDAVSKMTSGFHVLKLGSRGKDVADLQRRLKREDIRVTVDGYFGPETEKALKTYQEGQQITVDGVAGSQTWHQFKDSG